MKHLNSLLAFFVVASFIGNFAPPAQASGEIDIAFPYGTEHTIVLPYEKSYVFRAVITNNGSSTRTVQARVEGEMPNGGHVLAPVGQYQLEPGQEGHFNAIFEPATGPAPGPEVKGVSTSNPPPPNSGNQQPNPGQNPPPGGSNNSPAYEETATSFKINFTWEGGSQSTDVTVNTKNEKFTGHPSSANAEIKVVDNKNKFISGADVAVSLASGIETAYASEGANVYTVSIPSYDALKSIYQQYQVNQGATGYLLSVTAPGYKSYFASDYDGSAKQVILEPLDTVGAYEKIAEIDSGFSIWWIRASANGEYFAFSQGTHGKSGVTIPDQTQITFADDAGNKLWSKTMNGECWGLDISPNGEYVAAGCHDGTMQIWNRDGEEVWKYTDTGFGDNRPVRWIKFSPDSTKLLTGPVENKPERSGLFEVASGNLLWSYFTGDYLREGQFSSDGNTVYFDSANGLIHAIDAATGQVKWLGNGEHVIPFMLRFAPDQNLAVTAGKGRAFTGLNLADGKIKWHTTVDQTVTAAEMAIDGTVVGGTVGGMIYKISPDGAMAWFRKYGGLGHNGADYTASGQYALFGGPNPTLFDSDGNVLWQREPDKTIQMSGVDEIDTGGANDVWIADDASLIVLGGDDGNISFYRGNVINGDNDYSQITGPATNRPPSKTAKGNTPAAEKATDSNNSARPVFWIVGIAILAAIIVLVVVIILKKRAPKQP